MYKGPLLNGRWVWSIGLDLRTKILLKAKIWNWSPFFLYKIFNFFLYYSQFYFVFPQKKWIQEGYSILYPNKCINPLWYPFYALLLHHCESWFSSFTCWKIWRDRMCQVFSRYGFKHPGTVALCQSTCLLLSVCCCWYAAIRQNKFTWHA